MFPEIGELIRLSIASDWRSIMDEQQRRIQRALDLLAEQYPDPKANSNKSVGGSAERPEVA